MFPHHGHDGGGGGIRTHGGREPTHAFEACSFGRSDTPPRARLPDRRSLAESAQLGTPLFEELREHGAALLGTYADDHLGSMIEPSIAYDVPQ